MRAFAETGRVPNVVNLATRTPASHLLVVRHRNRPGVLALVNAALSDERINICGQYLQTTGAIGYVVIDIESDRVVSQEVRRRLENIDGTIRTRILF